MAWTLVEKVPRGIAAVVLLPSWLNPPTRRVHGGGTMAIRGWRRQDVASWMASRVLVALTAGRPSRPRPPFAVA